MSIYPPEILKRYSSPAFAVPCERTDAAGRSVNFACGCVVAYSLEIDGSAKKICSSSFRSNGCGYMLATADALAEIVTGRELTELHGLDNDELLAGVEAEVSILPTARRDCFHASVEALRNAFADYRSRQIEEFRGEKALICTCFGVDEETIEKIIAAERAATVEDVTDACRAGSGCGSCLMLIEELISQRNSP